jgi:hypothetical protein
MKYLMRLGWGIVIYAIMYVFSNALSIYGFSGGLVAILCRLVVLVIVATIAGRSLPFTSWKDIVPYSFFWMLSVIGVDAILTLPFSGVYMYYNWNIWIGYALVMLLPLAAPQTRIFTKEPDSAN